MRNGQFAAIQDKFERYIQVDPIEEYNQSQHREVKSYNAWVEEMGRQTEAKRARLFDELEGLETLKQRLEELGRELKQPANAEQHDGIDRQYQELVEEYNCRVARFNERQKSLNRETEELNQQINQRSEEVEHKQQQFAHELDNYEAWLSQDGPRKLSAEINQCYAALKHSVSAMNPDESRIFAELRSMRQVMGAHARNTASAALLVETLLDGRDVCCMSVDTGSSVVSVSPEVVQILGLQQHVGEEVEVVLAGGMRIKAPELVIPEIVYDQYDAQFVKAVVILISMM